jgi:hypothetical protein
MRRFVLSTVTASALAPSACGEAGVHATGTLTIAVAPEGFESGSSGIYSLSLATLELEEVRVRGHGADDGTGHEHHHHDVEDVPVPRDADEHEHDHEHEATVSAGLVITPPATVDLIDNEHELFHDDAVAGTYEHVLVHLGAHEPDTPTLLVEGTAASESEQRAFTIALSGHVDVPEIHLPGDGLELDADGHGEVEIGVSVFRVFDGVDLFAAEATDGVVVVDGSNNVAVLERVRYNLRDSFSALVISSD